MSLLEKSKTSTLRAGRRTLPLTSNFDNQFLEQFYKQDLHTLNVSNSRYASKQDGVSSKKYHVVKSMTRGVNPRIIGLEFFLCAHFPLSEFSWNSTENFGKIQLIFRPFSLIKTCKSSLVTYQIWIRGTYIRKKGNGNVPSCRISFSNFENL